MNIFLEMEGTKSKVTIENAENVLIPGGNIRKRNVFLSFCNRNPIITQHFQYETNNIKSYELQKFIKGYFTK
jgi:hypothetical protein